MSKTRKIVDEILSVRERRKSDFPQTELFMRLSKIESAYSRRDKNNEELNRYFPIAAVACIESYFRLVIARLIDSGEPYLSNAQSIMPRNNNGYDVLKALHGRTVSIGDVIGHSVPLSRLHRIDSAMSDLLEIKYLNELRETHDRWEVEVKGMPSTPIIKYPDKVYAGVKKAFELRHIFCHETSSAHEHTQEDIEESFESSVVFLKASEEYIAEVMHPNAPLTQTAMNQSTAEQYRKNREEMDALLNDLRSILQPNQIAELNTANAAWDDYLKAIVTVEGLGYEGGSIRPMIEGGAMARLTQQRSSQIIELIEAIGEP